MVGDKQISILLLTSQPFPEGGAATNRIRSYLKGLTELNHKIAAIMLKPTNTQQISRNDSIDGYNYYYASNHTCWKGYSFFRKIFLAIISLFNSIKLVIRENKKNKANFLLLVSNNPLYILVFFLLSKIIKTKYIQEKSEFPFVLMNKSLFGKLYAFFYVNIIYKFFDLFIVMTDPLMRYLKTKSKKNAKLFKMPMTVEVERFINPNDRLIKGDYIAYCGSMGGNKDGINILIQSFGRIAKKNKELKLVLIGDGPDKDINKLRKLIETLEINSQVIFTGRVKRDVIPDYLHYAKILALSRPYSLQSTGGFPTKLGEYLATGKPVVVTKVGEIPSYLKDGINAYLCEPNNVENFADKLQEVLDNYSKAIQIGTNGKKVVDKIFNYKVQSIRLSNFLINQL